MPYRWRDWAANGNGQGGDLPLIAVNRLTGDDLIAFINNDEAMRPDGVRGAGLFAYLRGLQGANGGDRRDVIATVFKGTVNRMINGYLLRDVVNKVNEIHFTSTDEIHTLSALYESMLKEMRDAAGDSGEFYTPRPVIRFIVEVINPTTLEPVDPGEEGELVLTTITKEGFPLVRYRTGDVTRLDPAPCPCGRTFVRMARVMGRTDDLILVQGVGFFPSQIEEILNGIDGVSPYFQILLDQDRGVETIEVKVEISDKIPFLDEVKTIETLRQQAAKRIKASLDIDPKVTLVEPKSLQSLPEGTPRVVDKRPG